MSINVTKVRVMGLSSADAIELTEYVDHASISVEDEPLPGGEFGDLGLMTGIVLLSIPALRGLIAYLAFRYRGKSFEQTIEIEHLDGTRVKKVMKWRDTSAEPVDVALARELASSTGLPFEKIVRGDT